MRLTELRAVVFAAALIAFPANGFGGSFLFPAACDVADQVRVSLNGIQYRIPSELQPTFIPSDAIPARDFFPGGIRRKQYCQSQADVPSVVQQILFPKQPLATWALRDGRYAHLARVNPLAIDLPPAVPFRISENGEITKDGLFRKVAHGPDSELASIDPLFFGARVRARCGRAGTAEPSDRCSISSQLPSGPIVMLGVLTAEEPSENWPAMLKQVEAFITFLAADRNHAN